MRKQNFKYISKYFDKFYWQKYSGSEYKRYFLRRKKCESVHFLRRFTESDGGVDLASRFFPVFGVSDSTDSATSFGEFSLVLGVQLFLNFFVPDWDFIVDLISSFFGLDDSFFDFLNKSSFFSTFSSSSSAERRYY